MPKRKSGKDQQPSAKHVKIDEKRKNKENKKQEQYEVLNMFSFV